MKNKKVIAYFITPHGFGHAARSAAIMEALHKISPDVFFHIFTLIPKHFFLQTGIPFEYHKIKCDIGLIQKDAFNEDTEATIKELDRFIPFSASLLEQLTKKVKEIKARAIISDISPLGIAVAKKAKIPSILIENFTWDWIYESYLNQAPSFKKHIDFLKELFAEVDFDIQTAPVCYEKDNASLKVNPVSRSPKEKREVIRKKIMNGRDDKKIILISMGGTHQKMPFIKKLKKYKSNYFFILPSADYQEIKRDENMLLLPHHSSFYHPDLVNAVDAVIGKIGYSTVAEVFAAQVPFGYIPRTLFRESPILVDFIRKEGIPSIEITHTDFMEGRWLDKLEALLSIKTTYKKQGIPNGANEVASFIIKHCL